MKIVIALFFFFFPLDWRGKNGLEGILNASVSVVSLQSRAMQ